jgi:hypothetical protein
MQMTNLQVELLKTFHYELSEAQLLEIKRLLSGYFADKAASEMDEFCKKNGWNAETIEKLSEEHMRTKY